MKRVFLVMLAVGAVGLAWWLLGRDRPEEVRATLSVPELLGGADTVGFARAYAPRDLHFPADHGPHPAFRTEWWYFTGNLESETGRRFGYQLTFFRSALAAETEERASPWAARDVYMAHFAVTDVEGRRFEAFDRFARGAQGLAGARAEPLRVWLEDWAVESVGAATFPVRAEAGEDDVAIDLVLGRGKPVVLQGERGLSRKGPEPGNASYYYSLPRMPTEGVIRIGGERFRVEGSSWLDREWSTSALGPELEGWDWFALQLGDGSELMYYRLRRKDGGTDPFSGGVVVAPDGSARRLAAGDVRLEVLDRWTSPTGARYPARWRLRVPSENLRLEVTPVLADQELNLAVRYWEGAVDVKGTRAGEPVAGRGYVEMTGY